MSIIIPVYNGENYLPVCLESVINQTEKSMEIIIVDDGSSDNTASIIREYSKKDSRIIAVNQEKGGVSSARNAGIRVSRGNYIWFVDADDWIDLTSVGLLKAVASEKEYDTIIFTYRIASGDETINSNYAAGLPGGFVFDKSNKDMVLHRNLAGNLSKVWAGIYRTDIIKKQQLFFDESQHHAEDMLFAFEFLVGCENGIFVNNSLYYYRKNPNSLTHSFYINHYSNSQRARMLVLNRINHLWPEDSEFKQLYMLRCARNSLKYIMRLFQEYKECDKKVRYDSLVNILKDDLFQDFATVISYKELGIIYKIELWLARRKMARVLWYYNTVINSNLSRTINRAMGSKLK